MSNVNDINPAPESNYISDIHDKIMKDQVNKVESILTEIKKSEISEDLNKMPDWVHNSSSVDVYLYFIQIIKENHKYNLDSNKLNISLLENIMELSKLVLSCMTINNHIVIIKIIKHINEIISKIMVKHYTANSNIVDNVYNILNNPPTNDLINVMKDLAPISKYDIYGSDDLYKNPYYKK